MIAKIAHRQIELAQDNRIAGGAFQRNVGKIGDALNAEAGGEALESERGEMPVGVAPRASQQVDLARGAFDKRPAQFGNKGRIAANCGGQRRVQCSGFISHHPFE